MFAFIAYNFATIGYFSGVIGVQVCRRNFKIGMYLSG